jgi:hypothetical protein
MANMKQITSEAQLIANTLPFASKQPQVQSYSPQFVASGTPGNVHLLINGNFPTAQEKKYEPKLTVGSLVLQPVETTTRRLAFDVSAAAFGAAPPAGMAQVSLRLTIPYPVKRFLIFKKRRIATYRLSFGLVPPSPGTLVFTTTVDVPASNTKTKYSAAARVDSDVTEKDQEQIVGPVEPDAGCLLLPESAQLVVTWSRGYEGISWQRRWMFGGLTTHVAEGWIRSINHPWWDFYADGGVEAHVEVTEACNTEIPTAYARQIQLKWGEQATVSVAEAVHWFLTFSSFDGRNAQIGSAYNERFLRVTCCPEDNVTISAPALDTVQW